MNQLLYYYLISINSIAFIAYGIDKWETKHKKFTILVPFLLLL